MIFYSSILYRKVLKCLHSNCSCSCKFPLYSIRMYVLSKDRSYTCIRFLPIVTQNFHSRLASLKEPVLGLSSYHGHVMQTYSLYGCFATHRLLVFFRNNLRANLFCDSNRVKQRKTVVLKFQPRAIGDLGKSFSHAQSNRLLVLIRVSAIFPLMTLVLLYCTCSRRTSCERENTSSLPHCVSQIYRTDLCK